MSDKIRRLFKTINEYMPYLIKDEMQKREVMRWLEKELQTIMARKQADEELLGKAGESKILTGAYTPSFFEGQTVPSESYLTQLRRTQPEIYKRLGFQAGETIETETDKAIKAAGRILMAQQAGEPYTQEDAQEVLKYIGQEIPGKAATEIVKQKEGAAEREIRGREVGVQERVADIRKGELVARLKETGGQIGDMTAKEARDALTKLGTERRRYQAMLETKTSDLGDLLGEEETNQIKKNIEEIDKLEKEIKKKYSKEEATDTAAGKITATNPETGEKIYWDEKLKKWLPLK